MNIRGCLTATILALSATSTHAAPPATIDDAGVYAWIAENLEVEGWTLVAADEVAVTLGSPEGVGIREDGDLQTRIRREYYGPNRLGPLDTYSNVQAWVVDCAERRIRIVAMEIYKANNLSGGGQRMVNEAAEWASVDEGSQNSRALDRICDAPRTGEPLS